MGAIFRLMGTVLSCAQVDGMAATPQMINAHNVWWAKVAPLALHPAEPVPKVNSTISQDLLVLIAQQTSFNLKIPNQAKDVKNALKAGISPTKESQAA